MIKDFLKKADKKLLLIVGASATSFSQCGTDEKIFNGKDVYKAKSNYECVDAHMPCNHTDKQSIDFETCLSKNCINTAITDKAILERLYHGQSFFILDSKLQKEEEMITFFLYSQDLKSVIKISKMLDEELIANREAKEQDKNVNIAKIKQATHKTNGENFGDILELSQSENDNKNYFGHSYELAISLVKGEINLSGVVRLGYENFTNYFILDKEDSINFLDVKLYSDENFRNKRKIYNNIKLEISERIERLAKCYYLNYSFLAKKGWKENIMPELLKNYDHYCRSTQIYFYELEKDKFTNVDPAYVYKTIVLHRQPVNIAMNIENKYDFEAWKKILDSYEEKYSAETSGYCQLYDEYKHLPPNMAFFSKTPIMYLDDSSEVQVSEVSLLSLVGYAFDSDKQPDYKWFRFTSLSDCLEGDNDEEYKKRVVAIFEIVADFMQKNSDKYYQILLPRIGCGAFGGELIDYVTKVWTDCHKHYEAKFSDKFKIIDADDLATQAGHISNKSFDEPQMFKKEFVDGYLGPKEDGRVTLFVNAWDPHSLAGNGNAVDPSLDGFWGRNTAISILSCSYTNPEILDILENKNYTIIQKERVEEEYKNIKF